MSKKLKKQTYLILERYVSREDWKVVEEVGSVESAMARIKFLISEDPIHWADNEFKIAAINDQIITVRAITTAEVVVKQE